MAQSVQFSVEKHELPVAYCGSHRRNTSKTEYDRFFMRMAASEESEFSHDNDKNSFSSVNDGLREAMISSAGSL